MTLAEVNVRLTLALPQGWTKEEVTDELNDLLTAFTERILEEQRFMADFEVLETLVTANPMAHLHAAQANKAFIGGSLIGGGAKLQSVLGGAGQQEAPLGPWNGRG